MKKLMLLLFILLPAFAFANTMSNPFSNLPDSHSASYSSGPQAHLLNPVFADIGGGMLSYRSMQYDDTENANHIGAIGIGGFAFTYGRFNSFYDSRNNSLTEHGINFYNITKGFFFNNAFGFGVGYSFGNSRNAMYDRYRSLSFGLLFRPSSFLSFGITVNDLLGSLGGEEFKHQERYSLSLRPFTERLTLSADAIRTSGMAFRHIEWEFGANIRIINDIDVFTKIDRNQFLSFGLRLPFYTGGESVKGITFDGQSSLNQRDAANFDSFGVTLNFGKNHGGDRLASKNIFLRLNVNRSLKELERERIMGERRMSFPDVVIGLNKAADDENIKGLILNLNGAGISFAKAQELRAEIKNLKASGKKVIAVISGHSNTDYYVAAAADTIYFAPNTMFGITGLTANVYFFQELMAKVGVSFEVLKHGKYKSVYESFTRNDISPETRENLTSLVTDLNDQFLSDIKADRNISDANMRRLFEQGIVSPEEAQELGFVDEVTYFEPKQVLDTFDEVWNFNRYINEKQINFSWGPPQTIAIIHVDGTIMQGDSSMMFGETTSDAAYLSMIENAFADRTVKAVIVRISSGGGSAMASDIMQEGLIKLHEKYHKPLVFSFGDMAASGGYYIACANGEIMANPGSLTGSIGVVAGKLTVKQLYEKLGVSKETIKLNEMDDIFNESRALTAKERVVIQKEVEFIYDRFTDKVMAYRNIPKEDIVNVAEGRVFTGRQAAQNKLTDHTGGLVAAIALAKERADIKGNYEIKELPDRSFALKQLFESDDIRRIQTLLEPFMKNLDKLPLAEERTLLMMPYDIEIK